jgi:flagellar protein FlaG
MNIVPSGNIIANQNNPEKLSPPAPAKQALTEVKLDSVKANQAATPVDPEANGNTKPADKEVNGEEIQRISNKLQQMYTTDLIFKVDEKSGEYVIQVIDKNTKEVIRQIPSKEAMQLKESIGRFQKGLLVNLKT